MVHGCCGGLVPPSCGHALRDVGGIQQAKLVHSRLCPESRSSGVRPLRAGLVTKEGSRRLPEGVNPLHSRPSNPSEEGRPGLALLQATEGHAFLGLFALTKACQLVNEDLQSTKS